MKKILFSVLMIIAFMNFSFSQTAGEYFITSDWNHFDCDQYNSIDVNNYVQNQLTINGENYTDANCMAYAFYLAFGAQPPSHVFQPPLSWLDINLNRVYSVEDAEVIVFIRTYNGVKSIAHAGIISQFSCFPFSKKWIQSKQGPTNGVSLCTIKDYLAYSYLLTIGGDANPNATYSVRYYSRSGNLVNPAIIPSNCTNNCGYTPITVYNMTVGSTKLFSISPSTAKHTWSYNEDHIGGLSLLPYSPPSNNYCDVRANQEGDYILECKNTTTGLSQFFIIKVNSALIPKFKSGEPVIKDSKEKLKVSALNNLQIYPNPTENVINYRINRQSDKEQIVELVDVQGHIVFSNTIINTEPIERQIDISNYSNGIYFLRLKSEYEIETQKVIKY